MEEILKQLLVEVRELSADVKEIKQTVNRIEHTQQDEVKGMLHLINDKVASKSDIEFLNRRVADIELEVNRVKNRLNN